MSNGSSSPDVWRKALVAAEGSLQDAIRSLDASGLQIALIVAPDGVLVGTITDGDIRRALLRGLTLRGPLSRQCDAVP
jgi:CBS domain-containing protein